MNIERKGYWTQKKISRWWIYGPLAAFIVTIFILNIGREERERFWMRRVLCGTNIRYLGKAIDSYELKNKGQFPEPSSWCDVLIADCNVHKNLFVCKAAVAVGDKGPCHYAMNPNCSPDPVYPNWLSDE